MRLSRGFVAAAIVISSACTGLDEEGLFDGSAGDGDSGDSGDSGVIVCSAGKVLCGAACIDPNGDPNNCGACNHVCEGGLVCSDGTCAATCGSDQVACGDAGTCASTKTDDSNCGGCGIKCASSVT